MVSVPTDSLTILQLSIPNFYDEVRGTPLYIASKKGHLKIVKELLKHPKIDVSKGNHVQNKHDCYRLDYKTPLDIAHEKGHLKIVRLLQKHEK